jgi:hypothetical protein
MRSNGGNGWNVLLGVVRARLQQATQPPQPTPDPNALEVNGFWIINQIYHRWKGLGELTLPMVGYPISPMFEGPVDGTMRDLQFFERGALAVYRLGTPDGVAEDNPFHVRMLTRTEVAEAWDFGVEKGFITDVD